MEPELCVEHCPVCGKPARWIEDDEEPRSAERRLMFALETFRTAAHAEGVREERTAWVTMLASAADADVITNGQYSYIWDVAVRARGQP